MGIGDFFRKVGSGIATGAKKTWQGAKNVGGKIVSGVKYVGKAAKPVIGFASKVSGLTEKIPGMIGDVSKLISGGLEKANKWIDMIPESGVKDKLKEYSGDAEKIIDKGKQYAERGNEMIAGGVNKTKPWMEFAGNVINRLSK